MGEALFIEFSGRERKDACRRMRGFDPEADVVQTGEDEEAGEGHALVAIDERMVARDPEGAQRCESGLAVGVLDRRRGRSPSGPPKSASCSR